MEINVLNKLDLNFTFDMAHLAKFYHNQQFFKRGIMFKILKFSSTCYIKLLLLLYLAEFFPVW
jgi:hypothetical protein